MTLDGPAGPLVDDVSLAFRAGEVTAIYGLLGAGRTEFLEGVCGARPATRGRVVLAGEDISRLDIAGRLARRLQFLPEDRQRDAVISNFSVGGNLGVGALSAFSRLGAILPERERGAVTGMMARLGVKAAGSDAEIHSLSGGNQQKVILGRCLMSDPLAVLLDEPSRGVDVGARAEMFEAMRALADGGLAIVFATSDLNEAMTTSDRVVVMANGRVTADYGVGEATNAKLVEAAGRGRRSASAVPAREEMPA
jgi:erythritol transport system ATP-binding protein